MRRRGVALVNALIVVAALAAVSAAVLLRAGQAHQRLGLRLGADQARAYLDAGTAQALADLGQAMAGMEDRAVRPGQGWDQPRDVAIDRGRVGWQMADLHGRFNLGWLSDPSEAGDAARAAFLRLAEGQGVPRALAERLARAASPDEIQRATAFGSAAAPDLPLRLPAQLGAVARAGEGGAAVLAPLWPLLAALPPEAGLNPNTADLAVMRALVPDLPPVEWDRFEAARAEGRFLDPDGLLAFAAEYWPEDALAVLLRIPMETASVWFGLSVQARLDSVTLGRSAVVALSPPEDPAQIVPRVVLSLPIVE